MRDSSAFECSQAGLPSSSTSADSRPGAGQRHGWTFQLAERRCGLRGGARPELRPAAPVHTGRPQPVFTVSESAIVPEKGKRIVRIKGDGRCLFRAMAKGLAHNKGQYLTGAAEEAEADELRLAVADVLCRDPSRKDFKDVAPSIDAEGGREKYCKRLSTPEFWGGEVEILVLSRMLHAPVFVYKTAEEAGRSDWGFLPIVKYGEEWVEPKGSRKPRCPVHLLYTGGNHYDLLL